jgi:Uma2 family endonuclease
VRQYLEAGTEVVWLIHRKTREVHVLERDGKMRYLTEEDSLEAPRLLPGFSVKVKDLFPR